MSSNGGVRTFDDLPAVHHDSINKEPPFDRHVGDTPSLSVQEINDIGGFLQAPTDGCKPEAVASTPAAA